MYTSTVKIFALYPLRRAKRSGNVFALYFALYKDQGDARLTAFHPFNEYHVLVKQPGRYCLSPQIEPPGRPLDADAHHTVMSEGSIVVTVFG